MEGEAFTRVRGDRAVCAQQSQRSVLLKQKTDLIHRTAVQSIAFNSHPIIVCKLVVDDLNAMRFFCLVCRNSFIES